MDEAKKLTEIGMEKLMKTAGRTFTDAQKALLPDINMPVNMILSNVELEVKVTVSSDASGNMSVRPVSSEDITRGGIDPGMLSTLRMSFVSTLGDMKTDSTTAVTDVSDEKKAMVPVVTDKRMKEAVAVLKSGGWQFETHAASKEEVEKAGPEKLGRVLRQLPAGGGFADKAATTVRFWVDLGSAPVKEIDGIGNKIAAGLSKAGITSVGGLSLANDAAIAKALGISAARAKSLIDMAGLMCGLAILGYKDEVVEVLVKGASIKTIEQLATASPKALLKACTDAIAARKVQAPRGFKPTLSDAESWVKGATLFL